MCWSVANLTIGLVEGRSVRVEVADPVTPSEILRMDITKLPRAGSPTTGSYDVEIACVEGPDALTFSVAPDHPVYSSWYNADPPTPIFIGVRLISDDVLWLVVNPGVVSEWWIESNAAIVDAHVEPYEPASRVVHLQTLIVNTGQYLANYVVTVTDCAPNVAPVVAQWRTLAPAEFATLSFDVRSSEPFVGGEACTVKMLSGDGYLYDEEPVVFPPPTP